MGKCWLSRKAQTKSMTKTPAAAANTFFGVDISQLLDKVWLFRRQVSKSFLLVEFARNTITLVEASYSENDVKYTHLRRVCRVSLH